MSKPSQYNSYDLTVGVIVEMEPMIQMLSPFDVPLLGQNGAEGGTAITQGTCYEKKVEWLDEELLLPVCAVAEDLDNSETGVDVAAGDILRFSVGDVIQIGSEKMLVSAISSPTLTVTRGAFSSTAATHTTGDKIRILGQALPEGSDPEAPRAKDRVGRYNYTQIFGPTAVRVSGTENVVKKYGLNGITEFDKQVGNRTKEQLIQLEQAIIYGKASAGSQGSGTDIRTMGGFTDFITTNVDSSTTTITEAKLIDQMQAIFDYGGAADRLLVGATQKRRISALNTTGGGTLTVEAMRTDNARGQVINYIDCDFGRISVLLDRWVAVNDAFLFNRDQVELCTLRPLQFEMLAKTGDSIAGQIVQERTLKFFRERHAARFSALT